MILHGLDSLVVEMGGARKGQRPGVIIPKVPSSIPDKQIPFPLESVLSPFLCIDSTLGLLTKYAVSNHVPYPYTALVTVSKSKLKNSNR